MEGTPEAIDQQKREGTPTVSRNLPDGTLIELIYDPETRKTAFAVWKGDRWTVKQSIATGSERLVPFSPRNNLIANEAVVLPSEPIEYGSEQELIAEIRDFIHRYAEVSPSFEDVATFYVVLTWLYDAFNEVPYLRLRGDFGTGKTRTLLTIGSLCHKAFFASGASSISPIFHTLDAFRGTLVFDEADFRFSDERAELVKILNNGNVRGVPVLRTIMNRQREFNPQAFHVFGPKIVATRGSYEDKGLESRFITEDMGSQRLRADIPINLPASFRQEARQIRNKLLLYRFHRRAATKIDETLIDPTLEPRLNQILVPLLSVIRDPQVVGEMRSVAQKTQARLIAERGLTIEARVLELLVELLGNPSRSAVPVAELTALFAKRHGSESDRPVTNRWIGGVVRGRLGLVTYKRHGNYVVVADCAKLDLLCAKFGIDASATAGSAQPTLFDEVEPREEGDRGALGTL
jgi:hypothetical protein